MPCSLCFLFELRQYLAIYRGHSSNSALIYFNVCMYVCMFRIQFLKVWSNFNHSWVQTYGLQFRKREGGGVEGNNTVGDNTTNPLHSHWGGGGIVFAFFPRLIGIRKKALYDIICHLR